MRTTTTFKRIALMMLFGVLPALPVLAQPGPGMGMGGGMGMGPGGRNAVQSMPEAAPGKGAVRRGGGMRSNRNNTGVALMTPEERTAHQAKMRQVKTYDECTKIQAEQRGVMETRAKEKGIVLPTPRRNVCENLKTRGLIK